MIQLIVGPALYFLPLGHLIFASGLIYHLANDSHISRLFSELHIFAFICPLGISNKVSCIQHISDETRPNLVFFECFLLPQVCPQPSSSTNKTLTDPSAFHHLPSSPFRLPLSRPFPTWQLHLVNMSLGLSLHLRCRNFYFICCNLLL